MTIEILDSQVNDFLGIEGFNGDGLIHRMSLTCEVQVVAPCCFVIANDTTGCLFENPVIHLAGDGFRFDNHRLGQLNSLGTKYIESLHKALLVCDEKLIYKGRIR